MTGIQIGGPGTLRIGGNRVTTFGALLMFVMAVSNLRRHQVSGGPEWPFHIQAKAEGNGQR